MSETGPVTRGAKLCAPAASGSRRTLSGNVAWALAGNVGYAACQWGVLASIAKLGTATDVGCFALGLALTAPTITLGNLHLRVIQATDARGDHSFGTYLSLRLLTTTLALAVITAVALGLGYRGATLSLILAVALAKAFEAVSDVIFGLLQKAENLRRIALSMLAKGVLSVLAMALVLHLTANLVLATFAMACCWGALLAAYDFPAAARLAAMRPTPHLRALTGLAWLALPMGCVAGIGSFIISVPRYAVEASLGSAALGHFAAVSYLFVAASQPMMALGAAVTPRLGRHYFSDRRAYRRLTRRTLLAAAGLGLLGVAGAALCGPVVLRIAYAPEYAADAPVLFWLAVAAAVSFAANVLGAAITAARRLPEQLPVAALSLVVCAVASHLLVPRWGLVGAAWAVCATECTRLACLALIYAALSRLAVHPRVVPAASSDEVATTG